MFTGIITDIGRVSAVEPRGANRHITIATGFDTAGILLGASIACDGVCLTVVETHDGQFSVDASPETLALTTAAQWQAGSMLNLERALKLGDELGGHMVSGHVDGMGTITALDEQGGSWRLEIGSPAALMPFIAKKGSITVDGISLTVNEVSDMGFTAMIIPHTWTQTNLHARRAGDHINLEIDPLARYIQRQLEWMK